MKDLPGTYAGMRLSIEVQMTIGFCRRDFSPDSMLYIGRDCTSQTFGLPA
jgi:hypothetical protein